MQVALHISKQFTYTLPCLKPLCGIDIWNHFKLFDMKCRRVAGYRRNGRKIIMNKFQINGRGRQSTALGSGLGIRTHIYMSEEAVCSQ